MTSQPETLVNQEMLDKKDQWSEPNVSPPVSVSDIRKWGIAVYWPDTPPRLFWDEEYAKSTRYGGIVAPHDFNPFAWPVEREVPAARATAAGGGVGTRGMNGGQTDFYEKAMRPGDVVSTSSALVDWYERNGKLGLTLFSVTEVRWTNQNDEIIKKRHSISIRY
ncbi:MAG: MaoC family dehydratase [SAR202 cluster bacterium]|nr:MaoC family dehydratase [SAR202 cluster bacterium]|tara:strand:- start:6756 stop:7247 length:492 start_codon:yes stop_codon:yes gene_type:complete